MNDYVEFSKMDSVWCGKESEQRAMIVDEIKCVGCLKCAHVCMYVSVYNSILYLASYLANHIKYGRVAIL